MPLPMDTHNNNNNNNNHFNGHFLSLFARKDIVGSPLKGLALEQIFYRPDHIP